MDFLISFLIIILWVIMIFIMSLLFDYFIRLYSIKKIFKNLQKSERTNNVQSREKISNDYIHEGTDKILNHLYYIEEIEEIKKTLKGNTYPCVFEKEKWKKLVLNCYAYALDIPVSDPYKEIWYPGCISNEQIDKNIFENELILRLKQDLIFLDINYRKNTDTLKDGEWRIAVYVKLTPHGLPNGFHFIRQDIDGIWSEKPSWRQHVRIVGPELPDLTKHGLYLETILILSKKGL